MRKKYKAFSRGDMKFIPVDNPKILAFTRTYDDEALLIIVNLSKYSQPAEIDIKEFNGFIPTEAFSKNGFPVIKDDSPYFFTMSPYSYHWFALQKPAAQSQPELNYYKIETESWESLFGDRAKEELQNNVLRSLLFSFVESLPAHYATYRPLC